MLRRNAIVLLAILAAVCGSRRLPAQTPIPAPAPVPDARWVFSNGFEDDIPGTGDWQKAWGSPWETPSHPEGASVSTSAVEGRRCLRVAYPKGGVGPQQTGIQWPTETVRLKGSGVGYEELYLRYYVYFEDGFDFRIGGKLPGLMSTGGAGGYEPDGSNAWLMRFMWREDAKAEVYSLLPPSRFNNFKTSFDVKFDFQFSTGKWYCIEQYAKLNSVGRDDGRLKVWIDGVKLLDRSDVLYRTVDNQTVKIGGFYFSTFHGGDTPAWAPRVDSYARFDAIVLSKAPVGMVASTPVSTSAPTTATPVAAPSQAPEQPRMALGHPRTIWDQQDVARYKELLKTSPELKAAFDQLQAWAEQRIREPLNVPAHKLEADGTWNFPAFPRGIQDAQGKWIWKWDFNTALQNRSADVSKLGVLYALTGNQEYADYARKLLLAMADAYGYGQGSTALDPHGFDHFEAYGFDGGDTGMFLTKACSGYDLIYNATVVTAEDRTHIEKDLVRPLAEHLKKAKYMYTGHGRWGMVCLYGIFISGVTLGDQDMVTGTLYGLGGTTEKPTGGFMDCFRPACIREDRLWGADEKPEDQIASLAIMTSVAEVMWRRGVDLYSHQDMALKKPFDAGLPLILPTSSTAAANDSEYGKLLGMPGINAYEYAFRRFHDARYLPLIEKLRPTLVLSVGELPSLFDARALPK